MRAQVGALIEQGRQLATAIEARLAQHENLTQAQHEAFSAGRLDELKVLREQRASLEEEALGLRSQLSNVLRELADHAAACLEDYRREVGGPGLPADLLPSRVEPDRIQECRQYLENVEAAVTAVVERLVGFRRQQLQPAVDELRQLLLVRLKAFGKELRAIEAYLDQEVFLDLPLGEGRKRLRAERALVEHKLAECEDRRRQEELQRRTAEARSALERLYHAAETSSSPMTSDFDLAILLLEHGNSEDARRLWKVMGFLLADVTSELGARASEFALRLVETCLDPAVEDPPFGYLAELGGDALAGIDVSVLQNSDRLARLASLCRSSEVGDQFVISRLCRLKPYVPGTSFGTLRILRDQAIVATSTVAMWFLTSPTDWRGFHDGANWLARDFEGQGLWKEAYASWLVTAREDIEDRLVALLVAAAASDPHLVPVSEETWWELLSRSNRLFSSEFLNSVVTVATLVIWYRAGFSSTDLLRSCAAALPAHHPIREVVDLANGIWPVSIAAHLREIDALRGARRELGAKIESFLGTVRTPAGQPSREFYRDVLLPRLKELFRTTGAAGLAGLDWRIVTELLAEHRRTLNPVAVQATERLVGDLAELAAKLVEVEQDLRKLPATERTESLVAHLTEAAPSESLLQWAFKIAGRLVSGTAPSKIARPVTQFSSSSLVQALFAGNPVIEVRAGDPEPERLFVAAVEGVRHAPDFRIWRTRYAVEQQTFQLADRYCEALQPPERAAMERFVTDAYAEIKRDIEGELQLANELLGTLEPTDEVEIARLCLDYARTAVQQRNPVQARKLIEDAMVECDRVERAQREARERVIAETRETVSRGVEVLCQGSGQAAPLKALLTGAIDAACMAGTTALVKYLTAIRDLLAGRPFDASLLSTPLPPMSEDLPILPPVISEDRPPVHLDELPRLVRSELELLAAADPVGAAQLPDWAALRPGTPSAAREEAAVALFRIHWLRRDQWEEPLVAFLEERARRSFDEANYLRAAEYFLAAAQVAYRATARLGGTR